MGTAEPLRENELASEQTGGETLSSGALGSAVGAGSARGKGNRFREKIQAV